MEPLLVLTGPTAVGKTSLSIALAKKIGGEIISADSMQVYRHMDIGSAKITPEEMCGIPHHLIDVLEPWEDFNVVIFQQKVKECLQGIYERGHLPILTGGTGFYIQAVLYDIDFTDNEENPALREKLYAEEDPLILHERLRQVDPVSANNIHPNNKKRIIRALEYFYLTGQPISAHNERERGKDARFRFCYFVLNDDRALLYQRIDRRVDAMIQAGLVEEVKALQALGCRRGQTAMQGLGYKEILDYLEGKCGLEESITRIKQDTRHFAKRQLTWFRRERDVIWLDKQQFNYNETEILGYMLECMDRAGIFPAQI